MSCDFPCFPISRHGCKKPLEVLRWNSHEFLFWNVAPHGRFYDGRRWLKWIHHMFGLFGLVGVHPSLKVRHCLVLYNDLHVPHQSWICPTGHQRSSKVTVDVFRSHFFYRLQGWAKDSPCPRRSAHVLRIQRLRSGHLQCATWFDQVVWSALKCRC